MNRIYEIATPSFAGLAMTTLLTASVFAGGPGTTGSPFLKIPVSGRATALGGTFAGVSGDITAIDYNPAGLSGINRSDMRATYIDYLDDTSLQALSVGFPVSIKPLPGYAVDEEAQFSNDKLYFGLEYRLFRAEDTARNLVGVKLEEFDVRDQLIQLGMAYPIMSRLSIGASGKFISSKIQNLSVSRFGGDLGVTAKFTRNLSAGLSAQNIGSSKAFETEKDPLPTLVRTGVAYRMSRWLALVDISGGRDKVYRKSGGVEWDANRYLSLRGGLFHDTSLQFSGGLGIRFTGPQKASAPAPMQTKKPQETPAAGAAASNMTQQIVGEMGTRLTMRFKSNVSATARPKIAVLAFSAKDESGPVIASSLSNELLQKREFTVIDQNTVNQTLAEQKIQNSTAMDSSKAASLGKTLGAEYVLVGNVDLVDDKYAIGSRIVSVEDAEILVTDYAEIAIEDFHQKPRRHSLQTTQPIQPSKSNAVRSVSPNIDVGLDYGLSSHNDLGITHTITLRVLY